MHRPFMDSEATARRADPATVEGRLWAGMRRLVQARMALAGDAGAVDGRPLEAGGYYAVLAPYQFAWVAR
jgi:amylosucrase